jgi:putative transposase
MEQVPAYFLKEFVKSQKFENTNQVMEAMKEMFAEVLQQVMSCELDEKLGYEKSQRVSDDAVELSEKNYRNGYSKKTVKT